MDLVIDGRRLEVVECANVAADRGSSLSESYRDGSTADLADYQWTVWDMPGTARLSAAVRF